jgi:hypothetical protein
LLNLPTHLLPSIFSPSTLIRSIFFSHSFSQRQLRSLNNLSLAISRSARPVHSFTYHQSNLPEARTTLVPHSAPSYSLRLLDVSRFFKMHSAALITLLTVGASAVVAADPTTVTQTATTTRTVTITQCGPSVTNCPAHKTSTIVTTSTPVLETTSVAPTTSSSTFYPASNTTVSVGSTGATTILGSTTGQGSSTAPIAVPTAAASGLQVQAGAVAAIVAAVIAMAY